MLCSPAEPGKPVTVSVTGAAASAALSVSGVLLYFLPDSGFVVVGHLAQAGTGTNASGLPTATLTSSAVSADYAGQPLTAAVVLGDGFAPAASPTGTVPAAALMAQAATVTFTVATSNSATAPASPPPRLPRRHGWWAAPQRSSCWAPPPAWPSAPAGGARRRKRVAPREPGACRT